jgi:diguanylate cyclase (GGDEF)-like protein
MMFSQVIKKTKNKKCNCSIAIIDIDNFKIINDTFGHAEGDNVLKMVSTIIKNNVRKNDVVVRYGGDEFAIIFFDISSEGAYQIAERVRQAVNVNEFFINKTKINLTISVGIVSTEQTSDMPNIMLLADKCLYTAKKSKNMVYELNVKLATVN